MSHIQAWAILQVAGAICVVVAWAFAWYKIADWCDIRLGLSSMLVYFGGALLVPLVALCVWAAISLAFGGKS